MVQNGQVFKLESAGAAGAMLWAYRYRTGGRGSKRVQRGDFTSEDDARTALERALEKLRQANGIARTLTLAELVAEYLAQHEASPVTLEKLRRLLTRAVSVFGEHRLRGGCAEAEERYRESLRAGLELGDVIEASAKVQGVAMAKAGQGDSARALELAASVAALWRSLGTDLHTGRSGS